MGLSGHASQSSIYSAVIAFSTLSTVVVCFRLLTRLVIVRQHGWEDVFVTIACALSIAMGVSLCRQADYGMGLHIATLSSLDTITAFKWFWNFLWLYYGSLCFTKLSILLMYVRVFPKRAMTRTCYILIAITIIWSCWAVFSSIFTCLPVSRFWLHAAWDQDRCLPRLTLWYTNAAINILTDFATALIPLPILSRLDISKRQKIILKCVFAAGLFTCLISVLRLAYIYPLSVSPDFTWNSPLPAIWSCVEVNTGIICSCVPPLKGLAQRFYPKLLDSMNARAVMSGTDDSELKEKSIVSVSVPERPLSPNRLSYSHIIAPTTRKGSTGAQSEGGRSEDNPDNFLLTPGAFRTAE